MSDRTAAAPRSVASERNDHARCAPIRGAGAGGTRTRTGGARRPARRRAAGSKRLPGLGRRAVAVGGRVGGRTRPVPRRRRPVARSSLCGCPGVHGASPRGGRSRDPVRRARGGEQAICGIGAPRAGPRPAGRDSSLALLDRSSPQAVPRVRQRLLGEARGNPLALLELPAALSDAQLAGRASLPEAFPLTARLRSAFTQQLKRLPASAQAALLIAPAESTGELRVIRRALAAAGLPDDALDPAEEAGMIRTHDGTLAFRHPRSCGRLRVGATGPAAECARGTGRCAGDRAAIGPRALASVDGHRRPGRAARELVGSVGAGVTAVGWSRLGVERVRAGSRAQRGRRRLGRAWRWRPRQPGEEARLSGPGR